MFAKNPPAQPADSETPQELEREQKPVTQSFEQMLLLQALVKEHFHQRRGEQLALHGVFVRTEPATVIMCGDKL